MTSDSFTTTEEATSGGAGGSSYSQQRSSLPSPWAQVVRGGAEPEPVTSRSPTASPSSVLTEQNLEFSDQMTVLEPQTVEAVDTQPEGSEGSGNGNPSGVKNSAWNKPLANGAIESSNTPVMGAASWPALSELTRPLPKTSSISSESSSKPTSDGSVTVSQAPAELQQPQRPIRNNATHHSNRNHTHTMRQRSMKRGGGAGGSYSRPPPPPTPPPMPPPFPFYNVPFRSFVPPAVLDSPVIEQSPYNGNSFAPRPIVGVGSHSHVVHDHPSNRKRNNFGPRPRADHQDRDWRGPRNHATIPPRMVPPPPPPPRGFLQQPIMGPTAFLAPMPIQPYGSPIGYEMSPQFVYLPTVPPDSYMGALVPSHVAPPSANSSVTVVDTPLPVKIRNQIEYYFSDANLVKDEFLRSHMGEEGWVPITLVAGFRRVQSLTTDIQIILDCLRDSTVVEVKGETVRRRNEWRNYLKLDESSSQSSSTTVDLSLEETSMLNLSLGDLTIVESSTTDTNDTIKNMKLTNSSKLANEEVDEISINPRY